MVYIAVCFVVAMCCSSFYPCQAQQPEATATERKFKETLWSETLDRTLSQLDNVQPHMGKAVKLFVNNPYVLTPVDAAKITRAYQVGGRDAAKREVNSMVADKVRDGMIEMIKAGGKYVLEKKLPSVIAAIPEGSTRAIYLGAIVPAVIEFFRSEDIDISSSMTATERFRALQAIQDGKFAFVDDLMRSNASILPPYLRQLPASSHITLLYPTSEAARNAMNAAQERLNNADSLLRVITKRNAANIKREKKAWAELVALIDLEAKALHELRTGRFCSKCKRSASEIEKAEHVTFDQHLQNVKGTGLPAPPELIAQKQKEFSDQISAKEAELASLHATALKLSQEHRDTYAKREKARSDYWLADSWRSYLYGQEEWLHQRVWQISAWQRQRILEGGNRRTTRTLQHYQPLSLWVRPALKEPLARGHYRPKPELTYHQYP